MPDVKPLMATRGGRRERRKAATRADLVRAGRALFSENGIYEVRIEDLAEQAAIGKGTVYLYFRSKQDLVRTVVEAGFEELQRDLLTAAKGASTFPDLVGRLARAHASFFAANPDLLRIFHQARGTVKYQRPEWLPLRKPLDKHIARISRLLASVPSPVRDRAGHRRAISMILFGSISGACSVRAALRSGPGDSSWSLLLSNGLIGLSLELARLDGGPRQWGTPGGAA